MLTALRGPDAPSLQKYKNATTAVIRHKVGFNYRVGDVAIDDIDRVKLRAKLPSGHFKHHAAMAFIALGLKWDELNS